MCKLYKIKAPALTRRQGAGALVLLSTVHEIPSDLLGSGLLVFVFYIGRSD